MKCPVKSLLVVLAFSAVNAQAQPAKLTPLASNEISVANYDDNQHGKDFVRLDPSMKRYGVVLTNHSDRPVLVAHIRWAWIGADAKEGQLTQEHNSFVTDGPVLNARSTMLILPNGMSTPAGQRFVGSG